MIDIDEINNGTKTLSKSKSISLQTISAEDKYTKQNTVCMQNMSTDKDSERNTGYTGI